jgi:hypothetical protein
MRLDKKDDAVSARIIPWNGALGVAYEYPDGKHAVHPIGADDFPIIRRLDQAGRLTYTNDAIRDRAAVQWAGGFER